MKPIKNWYSWKRGYTFGVPTFYNNYHTGLDLLCPEGTPIFASHPGRVQNSIGPQGGKTITLETATERIRFLHCSEFVKNGPVVPGDLLGYSGNTGLSTAPHVHIDVYRDGVFIDPEKYFMTRFKVFNLVGGNIDTLHGFQFARSKLEAFSDNKLSVEVVKMIVRPIYVPDRKVISDQEVRNVLDGVDIGDAQCIIIFYQHTMTRPWFSTQYIANCPKVPIIKFPIVTEIENTLLFELGHALIGYYNDNRKPGMPSISNIDNYEGGEVIVKNKIKQLMSYLEVFDQQVDQTMSESQVKQLQALEGFNDPEGVKYWTGKPLSSYLEVRIKDKIKTLESTLQQP